MEVTGLYDKDFYSQIHDGALRSARIIVPRVMEIFHPNSVIDFGCGTGAWLHQFYMSGVNEVFGLDGSDEGHELVPNDQFRLIDLAEPYEVEHKYDLAISLEVAEHLPESVANIFVDNVASASDNILWSAAVPGQRGVDHVNEQWPSYWVSKFRERGFFCNGEFRFEFWDDENVETWYKQNILLFSRHKPEWNGKIKDLVHPNNYHIYREIDERHKL